MKKIISFLIAVIVIAGAFPFSLVSSDAVSASDIPSRVIEDNTLDFWLTDGEIGEDGTVTVTLNVSNNFGFWATCVSLLYPRCLSLTDVCVLNKDDGNGEILDSAGNAMFDAADHDSVDGSTYDNFDDNGMTPEEMENAMIDNYTSLIYIEYENGWDAEFDAVDGGIAEFTFSYDENNDTSEGDALEIKVYPGYYGTTHAECEPWFENGDYVGDYQYIHTVGYSGSVKKPDGGDSSEPTVSVSDAVIYRGDEEASFTVTVSGNPGICTLVGYAAYDREMSFEDLSEGNVFPKECFLALHEKTENRGYGDMAPRAGFEETCEKYGIGSDDGLLFTTVQIENTEIENVKKNGELLSFTLDTSELKTGTYHVYFIVNKFNTLTCDVDEVDFDCVDGTLTVLPAKIPGDVNGDGRVNASDSRAFKKLVNNVLTRDEVVFVNADMNGDGKLNSTDSRALKKVLSTGNN